MRAVGVVALTEGTAGVVSKVEAEEVRIHREVSSEELSRQGSFLPRQRLGPPQGRREVGRQLELVVLMTSVGVLSLKTSGVVLM